MFKKVQSQYEWQHDSRYPWREHLTPNQAAVARENEYIERMRARHDGVISVVQGIIMVGATVGGGVLAGNISAKGGLKLKV